MRAMKDSGIAWIGEIPEEWKICKIKQLADQNLSLIHIFVNQFVFFVGENQFSFVEKGNIVRHLFQITCDMR